jgi:hypothetical protein
MSVEANLKTPLDRPGGSTLRRAGRMSWKEPSIHEFAVWVKDRVIDNSPPT